LKDPICGMTVTDKSFYRVEHQGQTVYFCSASCKARFSAIRLGKASPTANGTQPGGLKWPLGWGLTLTLLGVLLTALLVSMRWP
jgi:YHS domain-containing protein